MSATQKTRMLVIKTALGEDRLLLKNLTLTEQLGRLFQMEVELHSEDRAIKFDDIVGTNATVQLKTPGGQTRYFNGCISRFIQAEHQGSFAVYRATLVPWLWFLTRTADCRIFQNKKVPEIIEQVFKDQGFNDYQLKLSAGYNPWEYCVQYRETAFSFVSRLMESEGIYYYFEHQDGKHTLVLTDSVSAHGPFPGYETLGYRPLANRQAENRETVTEWVIEQEVQPGQYAASDYNFTTPKASLAGNANVSRRHQGADYEMYDYPGGFETRDEGENYAKLRIQELQLQHEILRGLATARGIAAGCKFTLKGHPRSDQNREYLVTGVTLQAKAGAYETGQPDEKEFFSCSFTAMPMAEQFRSARTTPRPLIRGPQTAIVVGPKGQKVYTDSDNYGRVKVQFPWDRVGTNDENSSCWVRVSQGWASKQWGDVAMPHIGDEVIVEFLEGDPDRPLITGRVYNADNKPPLSAADMVNQRIWRDDYGNEIVLNATPGEEKVRLYSPNNDSTYELGGVAGVHSFTSSSTEGLQKGNFRNITFGSSYTIVGGVNAQVTAGLFGQMNLGMIYNVNVGGIHNVNLGYQLNYSKGPVRNVGGADASSITTNDQVISAGGTLCLVGGNKVIKSKKVGPPAGQAARGQQAAPAPVNPPERVDNTSIIKAAEDAIQLTVGENIYLDDSMPWHAWALLAASVGSAAAAAMTAFYASDKAANKKDPWACVGISCGCEATSLIAGLAFANVIQRLKIAMPQSQRKPKGFLELNGQDGAVQIWSKDDINIISQNAEKPLTDPKTYAPEAGPTRVTLKDQQAVIRSQGDLVLRAVGQIKVFGAGIKAEGGPVSLGNGGALQIV
jgi:type VI secretion system secreted protein VgrG